jgi:hypothetical protein
MSKLPSWTDEDILAEKCADRILDNMCSPEIDTAYGEDLWEEIIRVLGIPNVRERMDAIEDLTLHDLMKKAAERRVKAMIERGDFQ